ncbi:formin-binding protein 4-like isoform X2 [Belonocnema kinseyi]|uniref:formin-binding protein 4-like isoform X2 n=1 Tax=Belonocnema kinseyi TaxID=2817044 RepID=UPI00143E0AD9|nr:formin-binding protein 4-like isoform X2 [Belonocnema kinseyi]
MKRRQRRPILDIDGEHSNSPGRLWQDKYQQIANDHPDENGSPSNPLTGLLGQYNSDSETEDAQQPSNKLNDKVNDFLKEIQSIAPEKLDGLSKGPSRKKEHSNIPEMSWQECFDESTGYPYYWHTESNEVTWEIPPELRIWKERSQVGVNPQNLHLSRWPGVSSNAYPKPQTEIPDGMIPKEVVARNRNRQAGICQTPVQISQEKPELVIPPHLRDDDSDDGKIEMITSFGNEESDGSESDTNEAPIENKSKAPQDCKPPSKHSSKSSSREKKSEMRTVSRQVEMGPSLPPEMISKMQESVVKDTEVTSELESSLSSKNSSKSTTCSADTEPAPVEDDILRRLKNQAKLLQFLDGNLQKSGKQSQKSSPREGSPNEIERNEKTKNSDSEKCNEEKIQTCSTEFKVSLVPGYEDDSDNEEEVTQPTEVKALFPISQCQAEKSTSYNEVVLKKVETRQTESGCIRIFEYQSAESAKAEVASTENQESSREPGITESVETESRTSQSAPEVVKPNIFLENMETPAKAFQRKKRIAFDVNRPKLPEIQESIKEEPQSTNTHTEGEKSGLGLQKEKEDETCVEAIEVNQAETSIKPEKELIGFVKEETTSTITKPTEEVKVIPVADNKEFKYLTEMITEKLKFLAEGCQMVSAVQVMAIQLQTLLEAWETGDLKQTYLHQWLTSTGRQLSRLEQTAAPLGWECQWDRSHKRYYYRNVATGAAQWTYPDADVIGGAEEMELCTTPPPELEEPVIIEREMHDSKESTPEDDEKKLSMEVEEATSRGISDSSDIKVPPPPQISSPSPPPPPRICAADLKRGKKRKGSQEKELDNKKEKSEQVTNSSLDLASANPPLPTIPAETVQPPLPPSPPKASKSGNNEPLPPGVDAPEMPYALAPSVLESGVLYAASPHQTNPIYAATMGNAILQHHTALMQGQLLHYPAYHHLHNQALVAAANRLGQEGVQFMMADYSHIYRTSQVIAKPPVKAQRESLGSAIDSFYNDIASIESSQPPEVETEIQESHFPESVSSPNPPPQPEVDQSPSSSEAILKDKKKKKAKLALGKKQKEMSSMVAKWQRVQQNFGNGS